MKKVETNIAYFNDVPSHIISEIFSKLPTKTCLNCKLVCKGWYNIITSSEFANLRSSHCSYFTILLCGEFYEEGINFLLLDLDKSAKVDEKVDLIMSVDAMVSFKPKLNTPLNVLYNVVRECNGLVFLRSWRKGNPYLICNLLTGEQVTIETYSKLSSWYVVDCGLGCCPDSQQFKVLRILCNAGADEYMAEIQTVGTNEWRIVNNAPQNDWLFGSGPFLHDSLHRYSFTDNCIWCFNFGTEQFLQIPTPDDIKSRIYNHTSVFNSCLTVTSVTLNNECEIWMMQEYGVKDSWIKQFVIKTRYWQPCIPLLQMITGEILFSYSDSLYIGASDAEPTSLKQLSFGGDSTHKLIAGLCHLKFSKLLSG